MNSPALSARIIKLGIGIVLMASGLSVTALLFLPYRRAMETRSWRETPCVITESRVGEDQVSQFKEPVARVYLRYLYQVDGKEHTGTQWRRMKFYSAEDRDVSRKTPHFAEARELADKYPVGKATVCWVNPQDPSEAVLEHQTKAAIYSLWWPMLFAVGGAGIAWSALRRTPRTAG